MVEDLSSLTIGIPSQLPPPVQIDSSVDHAPARKLILDEEGERLALRNALRYFPTKWHAELGPEFLNELREYGRIFMYRFRPHDIPMKAYPIDSYPAKSKHAAAIMLMIQNNLDLSLIHI